jgi:deferrochelatase/peroxidase EfeB
MMTAGRAVLELADIQHILLTRAPALTGRYEFLSFRDGAGGRAWLSAIKDTVHSAAAMRASIEKDKRRVTIAFTWNGLRSLGVDEGSLSTFPEEFRQGMAARAEMLGDTGGNAPENWVGGLASPDLHAIAILFARDEAERARCVGEHEKLVAACAGVEVLSVLDLNASPPFNYAHDHFGYRDRLSQPVIEGSGEEPTPGSGAPLKAGEFILGYPDESGVTADRPQPDILARNGSYMAYRRLQRLQLQGDGPAWICGSAGFARAPDEPTRHGGEHKPPPHDPSGRDLRSPLSRRRAGGRR